jgi:Fe-S-cluster containining protein
VLGEAVKAAAGRSDVREAVARVYADLQQAIDTRRPVCNASGRCCHFEEFGHRLFVTTLELAAFVASLPASRSGGGKGDCPFQIQGLCDVHAIRPFGCRVFFCDKTATQWQNEQYERFHTELKRLHETLNVPYFYVEWREALRTLGFLPETTPIKLSLPQLRL